MAAKRKKRKRPGRKKRALFTAGAAFSLAMAFATAFFLVRELGRRSLAGNVSSRELELAIMHLSEPVGEDEKGGWQEGWVKYQGKAYTIMKALTKAKV